jgi:hypothetical protein
MFYHNCQLRPVVLAQRRQPDKPLLMLLQQALLPLVVLPL